MRIFKMLEDETVLEDDYPIYDMYVYIVDGVLTRYDSLHFGADPVDPNEDSPTTVGQWKQAAGIQEVRRCSMFGRPGAKLGDRVEP